MARSNTALISDPVGLSSLLAVKVFYTLDEVAILLSVGKTTVERLIANGELASGIVPGTEKSRRVSRAQLGAFVESFDAQFPAAGRPAAHRPRRRRAS